MYLLLDAERLGKGGRVPIAQALPCIIFMEFLQLGASDMASFSRLGKMKPSDARTLQHLLGSRRMIMKI